MSISRFLVAGLCVAMLASSAAAQDTAVPRFKRADGQLSFGQGVQILDANGNGVPSMPTSPASYASTVSTGTVTVASTYYSALAASTARKGCLIVSTSSSPMNVFVGAPGSGTALNSIALAPGQYFSCAAGPIVISDQISLTSATAGATYVVVAQ